VHFSQHPARYLSFRATSAMLHATRSRVPLQSEDKCIMPNQLTHILHNVMTTLLRAVSRIFLSFPLAGLIAAGAVEGGGYLLTHQAPTAVTHILAVAVGLVVAYATALTFAVVECTRGGIYLARLLERDLTHDASGLERAAQGIGKSLLGRR
jgi:hypothetical protein